MRVNFNQPVVNTEQKKIHNVLILDSSGSMSGAKWNAAIEFANSDLAINKQETVDIENSVVIFSHYIKNTLWKTKTAQRLDSRSEFIGCSTALTDAIGETLTKLLQDVNGEHVLVKIFTDGEENASIKFTRHAVRELIQKCEKLGWTITFAGTEYDVKQAQKLYGVDASNTIIHQNTAESIQAMAVTYRSATSKMSKSYAAGEDVTRGFFKQINKTDD